MSPKTYILLVAHGSQEEVANREVRELAQRLSKRAELEVRPAFLDPVARPTIPEAIDAAQREGITRLIVLLYFLNSGTHVQRDIPALITQKQRQYPEMTITLTPHIGSHPQMLGLLKNAICCVA